MQRYKKSFVGGLLTLILGSSCCWISSLVATVYGAAILGTLGKFIGDAQTGIIVFGGVLIGLSIWQFVNRKKRERKGG